MMRDGAVSSASQIGPARYARDAIIDTATSP